MTTSVPIAPARNKRRLVAVLAVFAVLVLGWFVLGRNIVGQRLVLAHVGMTKAEVRATMGSPSEDRTKRHATDNVFFQGALESRITEGWIYSPPGWRSARVEVYFDRDGRVIGVNQGEG